MRNGVVHVVGRLLASKPLEPGPDARPEAASHRESLLAVLEERYRDVNTFVRSKVLQTWAFLCEYAFFNTLPLSLCLSLFTSFSSGRS